MGIASVAARTGGILAPLILLMVSCPVHTAHIHQVTIPCDPAYLSCHGCTECLGSGCWIPHPLPPGDPWSAAARNAG